MAPIRVLLADDHALVRAGFRALLAELPGVEVVGETADGREAVDLAGRLRPHVILMDLSMPSLNGLDATLQIKRLFPECRIVILSMHTAEEYVSRALLAGATGYLIKDSARGELEIAVRAAARGDRYLSPEVAGPIIDRSSSFAQGGEATSPILTPRQREVLQLIAEGLTTKEIAKTLGLGVKTVETHRNQMMETLDIHRIADLVRYAVRTGIVSANQ